ncbi:MAG: hemerythrin family protein [Betaproteobacteria bacterium]|nr:hemerythrin family protein [Betaproteobacteria bacterium]
MRKRVLNWEEARHSIGVPAVDEQHRNIIIGINTLHQAVAKELPHDAIRSLLANLIQLIDQHFSFEEALMQEYAFPEAESHRREHRMIVDRARHLLNALTPARPLRTKLAVAYLTDWTERHVLVSDRTLGAFLIAQGAAARPRTALAAKPLAPGRP